MSINLNKIAKPRPQPAAKKSSTGSSVSDLLNREISLFGSGLSWQQKEALYSEMAVLLKAGLDIKSALELVADNQDKRQVKEVYEQVYEALIGGDSLAAAMMKTDKFSLYELSSLRIAEESGKLLPVLERLATHFAKNIHLRRLLVSALSYPILVLVVAGGALLFLLNFLVPLFGDIYKRLNQELPGITQFIIDFSDQLNRSMPYLSLVLVVTIFAFYYFRKSDFLRATSASLVLRLPLFGPLIKKVYLSRFCHGLSFLLESRVPLTQALDLSGKMVGFYPIAQAMPKIGEDILQGEAFHQSLRKVPIFPNRMLALLKIGEETNHLAQMLHKMAEQYDEDVEQKTKLLGSLLEPLLIVFLAITVGVVLVSMYLPIFKLVTNFGL